jgi:hypothetical protein
MMAADQPSDHSELIFCRGFLLLPKSIGAARIPQEIRTQWHSVALHGYQLWIHPKATWQVHPLASGADLLLVGHAYDPWLGLSEEEALRGIASVLPEELPSRDDEGLWEAIDRLSGRFVLFVLRPQASWAIQDAVGLKPLFYSLRNGAIHAASHSQLLAEVLGASRRRQVDELVRCSFYGIGIRHLPGLMTPFEEIEMLSANCLLDLTTGTLRRVFPRGPHGPVEDWNRLVEQTAATMARSVAQLVDSFEVAVSLSLGTDSRTTMSACGRVTDRVTFFSYASNPAEWKDAEGARKLCRQLGLRHELYPVEVEAYAGHRDGEFEALLDRNSAGVRTPKLAEVAKLHTLARAFPQGRMEIKTPVSEIGRAIYCKKMNVPSMPARLTPRHMSNLYKRNAFRRGVLRWMDDCFAEYRDRTQFGQDFFDYEEADMFYWEHRNSQWAALANQDHDIIHDMTTIFNNRRLLVNFLKPERPRRLADELHRAVIQHLWPEVLYTPLALKTGAKDRLRKFAERWFFRINS